MTFFHHFFGDFSDFGYYIFHYLSSSYLLPVAIPEYIYI